MSDPFVYADDVNNLGAKHAHVAVVPEGIEGREALFARLTRALSLPGHFGGNWDALDECLRDLSWIEGHRVVLYHEALPTLDEAQLRTYLELLRDAVLDWRGDADDELVVGLPLEARRRVTELLARGI